MTSAAAAAPKGPQGTSIRGIRSTGGGGAPQEEAAAPKGPLRGRSTGGAQEEASSATPPTREEPRGHRQGFKAEEIESMYFIVAPQVKGMPR